MKKVACLIAEFCATLVVRSYEPEKIGTVFGAGIDELQTKSTEKTEYIAIFGDIRYYTNLVYIQTYQHSVDWILGQVRAGMQINCVLHTGDITQHSSIDEWKCFYYATNELATEIPFFL